MGLGLCFTTYASCDRLIKTTDIRPVFYTIEDPMFHRKTIIAYRKGGGLSLPARRLLEHARAGMARVPERLITIDRG
jgi:hypothetical protein